jgi:hypothetical protein
MTAPHARASLLLTCELVTVATVFLSTSIRSAWQSLSRSVTRSCNSFLNSFNSLLSLEWYHARRFLPPFDVPPFLAIGMARTDLSYALCHFSTSVSPSPVHPLKLTAADISSFSRVPRLSLTCSSDMLGTCSTGGTSLLSPTTISILPLMNSVITMRWSDCALNVPSILTDFTAGMSCCVPPGLLRRLFALRGRRPLGRPRPPPVLPVGTPPGTDSNPSPLLSQPLSGTRREQKSGTSCSGRLLR